MSPDAAYAALDAAALPHLHGHSCTDGQWWNENAGTRTACPTLRHLRTARAQVALLDTQVHRAAHDDAAVAAVARGLLAGTDLTTLDPETTAGWITMAQQGIEALAAHLDPTVTEESSRPRSAAIDGWACTCGEYHLPENFTAGHTPRPEDTADYGPYPGARAIDSALGPEYVACRACGERAIEHEPSRLRAHGVCPTNPPGGTR